MYRVISILMERDGMTYEEAVAEVEFVQQFAEAAVANHDYSLAEEVLRIELGLEMDYIFDILNI